MDTQISTLVNFVINIRRTKFVLRLVAITLLFRPLVFNVVKNDAQIKLQYEVTFINFSHTYQPVPYHYLFFSGYDGG